MSFTQEVKNEICHNQLRVCCQKAQLASLIQLNSSITISNRQLNLVFKHQNATIVRRFFEYVKQLYQVDPQLVVLKQMRFKKANLYQVKVIDKVKEILIDLNLWEDGLVSYPRMSLFEDDCCIRAYLAGCFLSSGSVNSPRVTNYHLELSLPDQQLANFVKRLTAKFGVVMKIITRRNSYVVYVKSSEMIGDFLKLIGAHDSLLNFENIRIERDFNNNIQRLNNCEVANNVKSQIAAKKQITSIELIKETVGLDSLEQKLMWIAELRLANAEDSLVELCEKYYTIYHEEISKSGMRHRLNKIIEIASRYDQRKEELGG